jgi:LmbE family N-acetylglucosaminyl deacetylase
VDVSGLQQKRRALNCHATQFHHAAGVATRLNTPLFLQRIESRDAHFGALAGVRWAEGLVVREPILRATLMKQPS